jgi:hypothetical protein
MDNAMTIERRAWRRDACTPDSDLHIGRVRSGHEVRVVNLSAGGALIDAPIRLTPGSAIDLRLLLNGHLNPVRGRVVRCFVSAIQADTVRYRAAVAFEHQVGVQPEAGRG